MDKGTMTFAEAIAKRAAESPSVSTPSVVYVERGDYLAIHFEDCPYVAERVDDVLTVYRSRADGTLVGCKLKGVSLLAKNVSSMISIDDGDASVNLLLLNAAGKHPASEYYYEVCKVAGTLHLKVPQQLLRTAA